VYLVTVPFIASYNHGPRFPSTPYVDCSGNCVGGAANNASVVGAGSVGGAGGVYVNISYMYTIHAHMHVCVHIYIYIYICVCVCVLYF
jgi:hypothetical protein